MASPNVGQLIDLLAAIPAKEHESALSYIMSEWVMHQGELFESRWQLQILIVSSMYYWGWAMYSTLDILLLFYKEEVLVRSCLVLCKLLSSRVLKASCISIGASSSAAPHR
jgi:hypothetical protein